jgi:hypothetical protein
MWGTCHSEIRRLRGLAWSLTKCIGELAYNESQGYVDVSMTQNQWKGGLTQEDNSHNAQPLHRGISLETQDILLISSFLASHRQIGGDSQRRNPSNDHK